jgi:hypothetical protein
MGKGKVDKSKWYHKINQLQKRLDRMEEYPGHAERKINRRKGQLKRLMGKAMGSSKYNTEQDW